METTATLADTLLDDLDDLSEASNEGGDDDNNNDDEGEPSSSSIRNSGRRRLLDDPSLQKHLEFVQQATDLSDKQEYEYIVESNQYLTQISDELTKIHKLELIPLYEPHFPELSDLLPNPVSYKKAVQIIQNETDLTVVNEELNQHFDPNQIITLTVAASTSAGTPLTPEQLSNILQLCDYIDRLIDAQSTLTSFVRERIHHLAPSTCALIGPHVTAQMVGLAGGLAELSQIPACNLQVLGQVHNHADRFAAGIRGPQHHRHAGILMDCEIFRGRKLSPQHTQKLLKQVASKLALAARCDAVNLTQGRPRSDAAGLRFRAQIDEKVRQWQEPDNDQAPTKKALPKPDLTVKKRRGGKRIRKMKERYEETALMKQANTRAFSTQAGEYGDDAMGVTLGLLDTEGGTSNVRKNANTGERKKMRMANTKASRKAQAKAAAQSQTSGLASTVAFTPLQAMELVNPDAQKDRVREANRKWFADTAGFQSALPKKS